MTVVAKIAPHSKPGACVICAKRFSELSSFVGSSVGL